MTRSVVLPSSTRGFSSRLHRLTCKLGGFLVARSTGLVNNAWAHRGWFVLEDGVDGDNLCRNAAVNLCVRPDRPYRRFGKPRAIYRQH